MLDWVAAEPGCLGDVAHLARIYAPGVEVAPDLAAAILKASHASIRRICVNLARVAEVAAVKGLGRVALGDWGGQGFFTGLAPEVRRFGAEGGAA
jgi:hypothetical protein